MKHLFKVMMVLAIAATTVWACQKTAETNTATAQDQKSSQGTAWIQANSDYSQAASTSPTKIDINVKDGGAQVSLSGGSAVVNRSGDYIIVAAPQVGNSGTALTDFRCWLDVNGSFVDNSNVLLALQPWTKDVIISQGIVSLEKGDVVSVYMASEGTGFIEAINPAEGVLVPSIIFTMYAIN